MHESSVIESILNIVVDKVNNSQSVKIKKISIIVGEDTGFMGDSLQFYFNRYSEGTIAEGAVLDMSFVKSKLICPKCGIYFERKRFEFNCPDCAEEGEPTKIGKECYIDSIEIEENISEKAQ